DPSSIALYENDQWVVWLPSHSRLTQGTHRGPSGFNWLIVASRRHTDGMWEMCREEAAALGLVIQAGSSVLKAVTRSSHIYMLSLNEISTHNHLILTPKDEEFMEDIKASVRKYSAKAPADMPGANGAELFAKMQAQWDS